MGVTRFFKEAALFLQSLSFSRYTVPKQDACHGGFFCLMILGFCFLTISSCGSKSEEIIQTYPNGEISRRHQEVNGKKEGTMTEYYPGGMVKGQRWFEDDLQEGKSMYFYPDGMIKEVQYHEAGNLHGGDTIFYENGKPQFLRNFSHGVLDGYIRKWGEDDSVIYEAKYALNQLIEVMGLPVKTDSLLTNNPSK